MGTISSLVTMGMGCGITLREISIKQELVQDYLRMFDWTKTFRCRFRYRTLSFHRRGEFHIILGDDHLFRR